MSDSKLLKFTKKRTAKLWRPANEAAFYVLRTLFKGRTLLSDIELKFLEEQGYELDKTIIILPRKPYREAIDESSHNISYDTQKKIWVGYIKEAGKHPDVLPKYHGKNKEMVLSKIISALKDNSL